MRPFHRRLLERLGAPATDERAAVFGAVPDALTVEHADRIADYVLTGGHDDFVFALRDGDHDAVHQAVSDDSDLGDHIETVTAAAIDAARRAASAASNGQETVARPVTVEGRLNDLDGRVANIEAATVTRTDDDLDLRVAALTRRVGDTEAEVAQLRQQVEDLRAAHPAEDSVLLHRTLNERLARLEAPAAEDKAPDADDTSTSAPAKPRAATAKRSR